MQDRPAGQMVRCSKARAMFAMRACRKSVMVGMPLTTNQMTTVTFALYGFVVVNVKGSAFEPRSYNIWARWINLGTVPMDDRRCGIYVTLLPSPIPPRPRDL